MASMELPAGRPRAAIMIILFIIILRIRRRGILIISIDNVNS